MRFLFNFMKIFLLSVGFFMTSTLWSYLIFVIIKKVSYIL